MAMTLALSLIDANVVSQRKVRFQVVVSNTSTSAVTLNSLVISEATEAEAVITQPFFMTPQMAVGQGNPVISASSSATYTFDVVFQSPNGPGASPNPNFGTPGGAQGGLAGPAGSFVGQPPDPSVILAAQGTFSDGSTGSTTMSVNPLSSVFPFPPVATGTLQLQFQPGFNLIGLAVGL